MSELAKPEALLPCSAGELPRDTSGILRILGRNTLWLWIDLGALRLGTMLAGLFLIRYFGPKSFGIYSMALAVGWIANAVIDLGLTRYSARAVAATREEVRPILALSLFTTIAAAIPTIAVLVIASRTNQLQVACLAAGFVLCNLEGTSSLCSSVLTADLRSRAILPGSIIGAAGLIGLTVLTIGLHLSVLALLTGLCFKSLLVLSLRLWQLRSYWPASSHWTWAAYKRVAIQAWPFFANNLTQVGYGRVALLCLAFVATQISVGWFAAAYTISDVIPQWSYAVSGALLPVWTRLYENGRIADLLSLRQRLLEVILFAAIPIWISLAIFAAPLCNLLGSQYLPSVPVLRIVALRSVTSVLDGFLGHGFLVAVNRVKERQQALSRCLLILASLSLVFGYFWGAIGVGFALVISDLILILQYLWIAAGIGLKIPWPSLSGNLAAAVLMTLCALGLPSDINFMLRASAAAAVYFVVLLLVCRNRIVKVGHTLRECVER
jgi:O-antigen/teichoic acid export membrane protein